MRNFSASARPQGTIALTLSESQRFSARFIRIETMPEAFTVLWTKERCRWLQRVGDRGPLTVVFGGPHLSQPSIAHVRPGDTLFPILVADRTLYVTASLTVREVVPADLFVRDQLGIE